MSNETTKAMTNEQKEFVLPNGELLKLRPVTSEDEDFLLEVYGSTRAHEMALVEWPEEQKKAFVKSQSERQREEYDKRFPDAEYDVILIDERPAGRIWIGEDDHQMRLMDIAILPEFQNRGAGTQLLRWLIDRATKAAKPLRHMVFMLNEDAHRFYERLGFVTIEEAGAYKHMEYLQVGNEVEP